MGLLSRFYGITTKKRAQWAPCGLPEHQTGSPWLPSGCADSRGCGPRTQGPHSCSSICSTTDTGHSCQTHRVSSTGSNPGTQCMLGTENSNWYQCGCFALQLNLCLSGTQKTNFIIRSSDHKQKLWVEARKVKIQQMYENLELDLDLTWLLGGIPQGTKLAHYYSRSL